MNRAREYKYTVEECVWCHALCYGSRLQTNSFSRYELNHTYLIRFFCFLMLAFLFLHSPFPTYFHSSLTYYQFTIVYFYTVWHFEFIAECRFERIAFHFFSLQFFGVSTVFEFAWWKCKRKINSRSLSADEVDTHNLVIFCSWTAKQMKVNLRAFSSMFLINPM